jgi:hypothetical protein
MDGPLLWEFQEHSPRNEQRKSPDELQLPLYLNQILLNIMSSLISYLFNITFMILMLQLQVL